MRRKTDVSVTAQMRTANTCFALSCVSDSNETSKMNDLYKKTTV